MPDQEHERNMIELKFPFTVNSHNEIEDRQGQILFTVRGFAGCGEVGDWACRVLNGMPSEVAPDLPPPASIQIKVNGIARMVKPGESIEVESLKEVVPDAPKPSVSGSNSNHRDLLDVLGETEFSKADTRKFNKAMKTINRLAKVYSEAKIKERELADQI